MPYRSYLEPEPQRHGSFLSTLERLQPRLSFPSNLGQLMTDGAGDSLTHPSHPVGGRWTPMPKAGASGLCGVGVGEFNDWDGGRYPLDLFPGRLAGLIQEETRQPLEGSRMP